MDEAEERVTSLEERIFKSIQSEEKTEKQIKSEESLHDSWHTIKRMNSQIFKFQRRKELKFY